MSRIDRLFKSKKRPITQGVTGGVSREAALALASAAEANNKYALAVLYIEKVIELWGETPELWLRVARLQKEMERYDASHESLIQAVRLAPADPEPQLELAELSAKQKNFEAAAAGFRTVLQLAPDWELPATKLLEVERRLADTKQLETADEQEAIARSESISLLDRAEGAVGIDPALFAATRVERNVDHRPDFVLTFLGIQHRTRWGAGPVVRGLGSLRGYILSIVPVEQIEIYLDGRLIHSGGLTVGPVQNERSDDRLKKFAFNAWVDFTNVDRGWHDLHFRAIGVSDGVREGINWRRERIIVEAPLPADFFAEAMARVPEETGGAQVSLVDRVRSLATGVAEATPNSYPGPIRNVAVLRLDGLGDVAVSVPFFQKLRALLPAARLVVIASTDNADGCRALDIFDDVVEVEFPESPFKQGRYLSKEDQLALTERLAGFNFDLAITAMVSDGPRELSVVTGAPVTIGFGGDDAKSLNIYYDTRDPKSGGNILNYAARYGMLIKALEVWLDSGARVQRRQDLDRALLEHYGIGADDRFVVMHTGSRIKATEWPGYAPLANRIADQLPLKVVYIANDEAQRGSISAGSMEEGRIVFVAGLMPFDHFDALLSFCEVFVGNDSGPGHLATLRGAKAIRLISARLGGSEWKSEMAGVCLYRQVPCAGCGAIPISRPEECTFDIACIKDITVDEVFEQVLRLSQDDVGREWAGATEPRGGSTGEAA